MTCLLTATEQRTTVTNLGIVKKIIIIMCSKTKSEREIGSKRKGSLISSTFTVRSS